MRRVKGIIASLALIAGLLMLGAALFGAGIGFGKTIFSQDASGGLGGMVTKSELDAVINPLRSGLTDQAAATDKVAADAAALGTRVQALESAQESETQPAAPPEGDAANMQEKNCMKNIIFAAAMAAGCAFGPAVQAGNAQACDPGFHWAGPEIGCLGETITDRSVLQAFDEKNVDCKPGEKRKIKKSGMKNGRLITWDVEQTCTP